MLLGAVSLIFGEEAAAGIPLDGLHLLIRKGAHFTEYAVLAILVALLSLFALFLVFYQNYALQKRVTIYTMLVTVGFLLTYAGFYFYYKSQLNVITADVTWWAVAVPVVVLILLFMAFLAIRKKEASVIFEASSFRLRD